MKDCENESLQAYRELMHVSSTFPHFVKLCFHLCSLLLCLHPTTGMTAELKPKPNIVLLYADDLGYGDLGSYGGKSIPTPNIDRLAAGGLRFTDAHCSAATCTPSRFSLLTGSYPFRNKRAKILAGDDALLIPTKTFTLPTMLKTAGYSTAIVGKWHLGLGGGSVKWNEEIAPGPNELGFDRAFIIAATNDRTPTVFIRDKRVVDLTEPLEVDYKTAFPGEPTAKSAPHLVKMRPSNAQHAGSIVAGIPRIGFQRGGGRAIWDDYQMGERLTHEAKESIRGLKQPFFLFYGLHQPHVPRAPHPRFAGKSGLGARGDSIMELDWCVGEIIRELETQGMLKNTLVILSSDNGPVLEDGYLDGAVESNGEHSPAGPLRGGKSSIYEGGTRVPLILSYPGSVEPGVSDALISQVDLLASLAPLVGQQSLPTGASPDGKNFFEVWMGRSNQGREELVISARGFEKALRYKQWKFIPAGEENPRIGFQRHPQLYDLSVDIGETRNLIDDHAEKARELAAQLERATSNK